MGKGCKTRIVLMILFCIGGVALILFNRNNGLRFSKQLGTGINLGNSLDVRKVRKHKPEADVSYFETYWGNPATTKEMIQAIADKGFGTIRIPVSWAEHLDEQGKIDGAWMERVSEVVDWSLETGMYVILDIHHEPWLVTTKEQEEETTKQLCSLWQQIAQHFANCGEHLIFEGMNEPRLRESDEEWTAGTEEMRQVVNRLNQAFVDTVRESGSQNKTRWLMIPAYCSSSKEEALAALTIPDDPHIMVAVHAYIPYRFAMKEDGERVWNADNPDDTEDIDAMQEVLDGLFIKKKIPVVITEFGCIEKEQDSYRNEWTDYYIKSMKKIGVPCIWWDDGDEFKIFDRDKLTWPHEELTEIILQ